MTALGGIADPGCTDDASGIADASDSAFVGDAPTPSCASLAVGESTPASVCGALMPVVVTVAVVVVPFAVVVVVAVEMIDVGAGSDCIMLAATMSPPASKGTISTGITGIQGTTL
jgi:hypothetical protein